MTRFINAQLQPTLIEVPGTERVCVTCENFRHYHTENRGNVAGWHPTNKGMCTAQNCQKKAWQTCKKFERVHPK